MDLFAEGLSLARKRSATPLVQGDMDAPPFGTGFDVIGLFDVLEHLPNDRQVLRCLSDMLTPGGALILTVPAHNSLWSYFDEVSRHFRRYDLPELRQRLLEAGLDVDYASEFMMSIFPAVWLGRRLAGLRKRPNAVGAPPSALSELHGADLRIVPFLNEILTWVLSAEAHIISRAHRLPIGTSIIAVARRPT